MKTPLQYAMQELGVQEIAGPEHNQRVVNYSKESGISGISDDETAWCSAFVNWCCFKAECERSDRANARSWLTVGRQTNDPAPGDVVVFWRESRQSWKGHVGFFTGFNKSGSKVFCLGGNQRNQVSISAYDAGKVLAFVKVDQSKTFGIPEPVLKLGDRGGEVEKLQIILNDLGYACGDPDGIFGNKSFEALKNFQSDHRLEIDGVYGGGTKTKLESILQS